MASSDQHAMVFILRLRWRWPTRNDHNVSRWPHIPNHHLTNSAHNLMFRHSYVVSASYYLFIVISLTGSTNTGWERRDEKVILETSSTLLLSPIMVGLFARSVNTDIVDSFLSRILMTAKLAADRNWHEAEGRSSDSQTTFISICNMSTLSSFHFLICCCLMGIWTSAELSWVPFSCFSKFGKVEFMEIIFWSLDKHAARARPMHCTILITTLIDKFQWILCNQS